MKTKIYSIVLSCLLLISCSTGKTVYETDVKGNKVRVCNAGEITNIKDLLLSELVESVEVVRLETTDSCLIKDIWRVFVTDNYLGVLEHGGRPYKLFDRKGKFVSQIGSIGQGPNEYISLINSSIDEKNRRIYLASFARASKLLCYDFEGNPQGEIPLYYKSLDKVHFFINNGIITVFSIPVTNREVFAFQQNMKGELIQAIPATESMYADSYDNELFASCNKGVFSVYYTSIDTLFNYDPKSNVLVPKYHTQFEGNKFHVYQDSPNYYITLSNPNIIVDKRTGEMDYYEAKNDFLGGLDIGYVYINNDYAVVVCEAFKLRENLEKNIGNSNLTKEVRNRMFMLINKIADDDNPVLIIGKLK